MPMLQLSTGVIHYTERGQGTPLILLHANPGDSQDFEAIIPGLSIRYRVLALDWPGYGLSALPQNPEGVDALFFYRVLREFLTTLQLPPAFFIGNSIGGNAAARLAIELPEAVLGLVLVTPGGFTTHNFITRSFCQFQASRWSLSPYHFARHYLKERTATVNKMLQRAATVQSQDGPVALNRAVWRSFNNPKHDLRQAATRITAPTLLIFGQRDPIIRAKQDGRQAAQTISSARLVILPCGHAPFAEVPALFMEEIKLFFAANGDPLQTSNRLK